MYCLCFEKEYEMINSFNCFECSTSLVIQTVVLHNKNNLFTFFVSSFCCERYRISSLKYKFAEKKTNQVKMY